MRALPAPDAPASERILPRDPGPDPDPARPTCRSAAERLAADRAKFVRGQPGTGQEPALGGGDPGATPRQEGDPGSPARAPVPVVRRVIARKPLRPDSLVIYRQKCEFVRGPGADSRGSLVKKLFQGPGKDRAPGPLETHRVGGEGRAKGEEAARTTPGLAPAPAPPASPRAPAAAASSSVEPAGAPGALIREPRVARRGGLHRSQSDLSSRYSAALAESDTFFRYCGLDPDVVEALGRENFSAGSDSVALKVRSVSVATSDSGFSGHSGRDDRLREDLAEPAPSTTSVIERNARIIKWLYACRKARESPRQGPQGPA